MRNLFVAGHGSIDAKKTSWPFDSVGRDILDPTVTYQAAELPAQRSGETFRESRWTIIASAEAKLRGAKLPLHGIAKGVALIGNKALSHVPHGRFGKLRTVDRSEIEALRCIYQLITEY